MTPTPLEGVYLIDIEKKGDERGFFARAFCTEEFREAGLETTYVQANDSLSIEQGTLRGMHYQLPPFAETKLVKCISGSVYDVVVDLRKDSPSFKKWTGAVLTAENRTMMYVPEGCAHGFLTLEPNSEVFYLVSALYSPEYEKGVRWNDPTFNIAWPEEPKAISKRDSSHPDFNPSYHLGNR